MKRTNLKAVNSIKFIDPLPILIGSQQSLNGQDYEAYIIYLLIVIAIAIHLFIGHIQIFRVFKDTRNNKMFCVFPLVRNSFNWSWSYVLKDNCTYPSPNLRIMFLKRSVLIHHPTSILCSWKRTALIQHPTRILDSETFQVTSLGAHLKRPIIYHSMMEYEHYAFIMHIFTHTSVGQDFKCLLHSATPSFFAAFHDVCNISDNKKSCTSL